MEQIKTKMRQKLYETRKEATDLTQKVKLLEKEELKKEVVYIRHVECNIENTTKCYVHFDTRYSDPNMHYDDDNDSWSYYPRLGCSGMQPKCNLWILSIVGCQYHHILISPSFE